MTALHGRKNPAAPAAPGRERPDSVVFDCDGVLVDISGSYDRTIDMTCSRMLRDLAGIEAIPIDGEIIEGFKASGGFNDEVDLTYASILSLYAADRLGRDPHRFIREVIGKADRTGILSVQRYVGSLCDTSGITARLGRLEDRHGNPVYSLFEQIFFGPRLYRKIFGGPPGAGGGGGVGGMIDNDVVILSDGLLRALRERFGGRIAIVSGRGIESARHTLGSMLDRFDLGSSAFLEDEPRAMAKPNPASLVRAIDSMGSRSCLYVGDSMEDRMMARGAAEAGGGRFQVQFCAIVGTSSDPGRKRRMFGEAGAEMILRSIDEIPKALNLVWGEPYSRDHEEEEGRQRQARDEGD